MTTIHCKKKFITLKSHSVDDLNKEVNKFFKKYDKQGSLFGTAVEFHGKMICAKEKRKDIFIQNLILWTPIRNR